MTGCALVQRFYKFQQPRTVTLAYLYPSLLVFAQERHGHADMFSIARTPTRPHFLHASCLRICLYSAGNAQLMTGVGAEKNGVLAFILPDQPADRGPVERNGGNARLFGAGEAVALPAFVKTLEMSTPVACMATIFC